MGRVQRHYNVLFREIERDQNFATRDAARDLQRALDDPAVRERAPDAADPEFQDLLRQARAAVDEVRKGAEHFDNEALVKARGEVSARCQACHERFRWKPE
jgi:cytochrome c556